MRALTNEQALLTPVHTAGLTQKSGLLLVPRGRSAGEPATTNALYTVQGSAVQSRAGRSTLSHGPDLPEEQRGKERVRRPKVVLLVLCWKWAANMESCAENCLAEQGTGRPSQPCFGSLKLSNFRTVLGVSQHVNSKHLQIRWTKDKEQRTKHANDVSSKGAASQRGSNGLLNVMAAGMRKTQRRTFGVSRPTSAANSRQLTHECWSVTGRRGIRARLASVWRHSGPSWCSVGLAANDQRAGYRRYLLYMRI